MPGRRERSAEGCRRGVQDRAGEAPGALGHMQFARRIALLAHDALLSRRRAAPVNLSGEVARKASTRHCHDANLSGKPIRRRRIEFNSALQRTRLLPGSQQGSTIVVVMPRSSYCSRAAERER